MGIFYHTTRRHIPDDCILNIHWRQKLRSRHPVFISKAHVLHSTKLYKGKKCVYLQKVCKQNADCLVLKLLVNIATVTAIVTATVTATVTARLAERVGTGFWIRNINFKQFPQLSYVLIRVAGYWQRTALSRSLFEKLKVAQVVETRPMFRETRRFTDTVTRAYNWHWQGWPQRG